MQNREIDEILEFIKKNEIDSLKQCLEETISIKDVDPSTKARLEKLEVIKAILEKFVATKNSFAEFLAYSGNVEILEFLAEDEFPLTTNDHGTPESALGILFWACLCPNVQQKKEFLTHLKNNYEKYNLKSDGISIPHIKAALGETVAEEDTLNATDQFGFYPYHYAGLSGLIPFTEWVPQDLDNYEKIKGEKIFAGVDLPWLIGRGGFNYFDLLKNIDFTAHPECERHASYDVSTARLITQARRFDLLSKYLEINPTCNLDLEAGNHENLSYEDSPLALILAWEVERCQILINYLQANPDLAVDLNMQNKSEKSPGFGISLGWLFAAQGRFQYLNRHRFSAGYLDLNVTPLKPDHEQSGLTLAHLLLLNNQIGRLEEHINDPQAPRIQLNAAPKNSNYVLYKASVAFFLASRNRIDLIEAELRNHPQEIDLNAGPNENTSLYGTTVAFFLGYHDRLDLLMDELERHPQEIDLNAGPKYESHSDYGVTLAWIIAFNGNWALLEKLEHQGMKFDLHAAPKKKEHPYFGVTIAEMRRKKNALLKNSRKKLEETEKRKKRKCRTRNNRNKKEGNIQSYIPSLSEQIKNNQNFANEVKNDLESLENLLKDLDSEKIKDIFNESIPYQNYEDASLSSKRNLIKKFALELSVYKNIIQEKKKLLKTYQEKMDEIYIVIEQLNKSAENKQVDETNKEILEKLQKSIQDLQNNIKNDKRILSEFKSKILNANERLQQNLRKKSKTDDFRSTTGSTLKNSSKNKLETHRTTNKFSPTTTKKEVISKDNSSLKKGDEKGKNQTRPTNDKQQAGENTSPKQADGKSKNQRKREKKRRNNSSNTSLPQISVEKKQQKPADEKLLTQSASLNNQPIDVDIPVPFTTGLTLYYKPGTQPLSSVATQKVSPLKPKKPAPIIQLRNPEECLNEVNLRVTTLFSSLSVDEDGENKEKEVDTLQITFNEYMLKFKLLKLLESIYQFLKSINDKDYKYVKGFRNLICHDHYALTMKEVSGFIKEFANTYDNFKESGEKEDELLNTKKYVEALQQTINKDKNINYKIDTFLISSKRKKRTHTLFSDFTDPAYIENHLQNDIKLIQYIFNVKINEILAEKNQGNALSIIKEFNPDLYALCEFLIMSIYENMKKLNYHSECEILKEARNHISHDFDKLPVFLMQKIFAHDLPLIVSSLIEKDSKLSRSLV